MRHNYSTLENVLARAYEQAAAGKGNERHAQGQAFEKQPMQTISDLLNTHDGMLYQAIKKIQESQRMGTSAAVAELLGAINYLAGAIIRIERQAGVAVVAANDNRPCCRTSDKPVPCSVSCPQYHQRDTDLGA